MSDKILLPHKISVENRKEMSVGGVVQVVSYDEYRIVLRTDYGTLIIQGRDLIAGEINSATNTLKLTGRIDTLQYKAAKDKSESLFARMMK